MRDVELGDVLGELAHVERGPGGRHDVARLDRVPALGAQREVGVRLLEVGEVERRHQTHRLERILERSLEGRPKSHELGHRGHPVEAAELDVDRVHRAAPDQGHQLVADLLQPQATFDGVREVLRHLDRAGVPEEVGGVQQVDVQRVALDPLAAVQQPPHGPDRVGHADTARVLEREARAELVGDRADPADAGGDVRRLGPRPTPQERLVEAGRLEDPQLDRADVTVLDLEVHAPLALDARQRADVQHLTAVGQLVAHVIAPSSRAGSCRSLSRRNGSDAALNVR
ncbi:hypothetical protein VTA80_01860 [Pengzhenrongella phosphoraccumulans]